MKEIKTLKKNDFYWVKWKVLEIKKKAQELLEERKKLFQKIKNIKAKSRNFKNTVFALEKNNREMSSFMVKVDILLNMSPIKKIREVSAKVEVEMANELVDIDFDKGIFDALKEYKNNFFKKEKIDQYDKKLFLDYLKDYKDMGFALGKEEQKRLKEINKKIAKLSSEFSVNINNWNDKILLSEKDLGGLSDVFLKSLKKVDKKYEVTLDYPQINPFLEMSENDLKREEILKKSSRKGGEKNLKLLPEILNLKKEKASLLGYKNYPDYILKDRMAKNAKTVEKFILDLLEKVEKSGKTDLKELESFKKELNDDKKTKLQAHDISFLISKLSQKKFNINQQELKEYFQLDIVKKEMFDLFSKLFGFEIKLNKNISLWHKDVEFYDIYSAGKKISHLALDLFPREGKYGHAAMWDLQYGFQIDLDRKEKQAPMALVVCNFAKKNGKTPSLLSHYEIQVLFHEFGHALHHILSEAKHASDFGISVAWDFVETPSQLLENWAWEKDFIYKISKHWKSEEKLSKKKIKDLIESREFMEAYVKLRQLLMTKFDFDIHFKNIKEPNFYWKKIMSKGTGIEVYKESLMPAGFGHIVGGYDSGYYSYLWALVYADDIFSIFQKEGVYSKKVGARYRKEILSQGGQKKEKEMVENFLKRKSNAKAFLKKLER